MASTVNAVGSYSTVTVRDLSSPLILPTPLIRPTAIRMDMTQPAQVIPGTFKVMLSITTSSVLLDIFLLQEGYIGRMSRSKNPGLAPEKMRAPPTRMIRIVDSTWMRRPHKRRGMETAGPREAPKNASRNINNPMVRAKIRNASSPVRKPPIAVAKTATAARKGAVQPTPTATNPPPNKKAVRGVRFPIAPSHILLPRPITGPTRGNRLV